MAQVQLDAASRKRAEIYSTPAKTAAGELPAIILTPDEAGFEQQTVTRAEYHEYGHALCRQRFLA